MTAAGAFADKAHGLGWMVGREKRPGWRGVQCALRNEQFTFEWTVNERTGNYVFAKGEHRVSGCPPEEWSNLAAALRIMADPGYVFNDHSSSTDYTRLPFDPSTATDADVLNRVRGREITWRNSVTGALEAAIVPWEGRQTHFEPRDVLDGPARRVLTFASFEAGATPVAGYPVGHDTRAGFRSVRLSALVSVGDKCYKPRSAAA